MLLYYIIIENRLIFNFFIFINIKINFFIYFLLTYITYKWYRQANNTLEYTNTTILPKHLNFL